MRTIKSILFYSVCILSLMACSQVKEPSTSSIKPSNSEAETSPLETQNQPIKQTRLTMETILQLTEQQIQGHVLEVKYEEGYPNYYQVTLVSDGVVYELDFNAESGDLLSKRPAPDEVNRLENTQLSFPEVIAIAKGTIEGAEVNSVQLEGEERGIIYQVELERNGIDYDLKIDANDGSIIKVES